MPVLDQLSFETVCDDARTRNSSKQKKKLGGCLLLVDTVDPVSSSGAQKGRSGDGEKKSAIVAAKE